MMMKSQVIWVLLLCVKLSVADKPCMAKKFDQDSIVCVCNANYCDEISKIQKSAGKYVRYSSDIAGLRFKKDEGLISTTTPILGKPAANVWDWIYNYWLSLTRQDPVSLRINRSKLYQSIHGFGGGFTDATGINFKNLSTNAYNYAMRSYFSEDGLEFNIGRVPIGGTDFSTYPYAYNMLPENDFALSNFSLTIEDYKYKIPLIKDAQRMATDELYLMAATWSPPIWMKTNRAYNLGGYLLIEHYKTYADYHLRFLEEYEKSGLNFWTMSTTNEPMNGNYFVIPINNLGWLPQTHTYWIEKYFCPTIRGSKFSNIKILAYDDVRLFIKWWLDVYSNNTKVWDCVDGIAIHYYMDDFSPDTLITETHDKYPNKFIINTESSAGDSIYDYAKKPRLGLWLKGEYLLEKMMRYFNNWSTGWVDWNFALNMQCGPMWAGPIIESLMIVNAEKDEFYKQPAFYAMGHFSKFVPRGSKRVNVETVTGHIYNVAFLRPDGGIAVIFYNPSNIERSILILEENVGHMQFTLTPRSVHSVVYWKS